MSTDDRNLVNRVMHAFWSADVPHANMGDPERFVAVLEEVSQWLLSSGGNHYYSAREIKMEVAGYKQSEAQSKTTENDAN